MKDNLNPKKILLFKIGSIGDVLMTTPLVRQLRKEFPKSEIVYYVGKYSAPVLVGNKNVSRLVPFDQSIFIKKNLFKAVKLRNEIKKQNFDVAFVLDKHWAFGAFIKSCGIPVRIGFDRDGEGKYHTHKIIYKQVQHEITYYLSLLETIEIKPSNDTQMDLHLSKKDTSFADNFFKKNKFSRKVIGITLGGGTNPGAVHHFKRWSTDRYIELVHNLAGQYKILLLGGPEDKELNENIIKFMKNKNIINGANDDIKKSAALMKKCSVIVCNDSGPMHLASAVNNRIVSLFGPTSPERLRPLHEESIAIWHDKDIYEDDYILYGKVPDKSKKWMRRITVKEVENAVRSLLSR